MKVVVAPAALRKATEAARAEGRRVGVVPTMGALHEGHLSLVKAVRERGADWIAATIFVNPLQFGEGEDLDRYPRTLSADLDALEAEGVDLVFTPEPAAMYPAGFSTTVSVEGVATPLEGVYRPGHLEGVTTVVSKLLNLVGPSLAVFGRKDYQQLATLRRMVLDLDMPIEVVGAPIVREPDGLALSSRNRYLSADDRARALGIVTGLRMAWDAYAGGVRDVDALVRAARGPIEAQFDRVDYVALVDADDLSDVASPGARALLASAAHLGGTRLIDNVVLGEDPRP